MSVLAVRGGGCLVLVVEGEVSGVLSVGGGLVLICASVQLRDL